MGVEATDLFSTYLTTVSLLIAASTFIWGYFAILEYKNELIQRWKARYKLLILSLLSASIILVGHAIILIITNFQLEYFMAFIAVSLPIGILAYITIKPP